MGRFDFVKYDEKASDDQAFFKDQFETVTANVEAILMSPRAKALVYTKLEEAYSWCGKAIRNQQIARGSSDEEQQL